MKTILLPFLLLCTLVIIGISPLRASQTEPASIQVDSALLVAAVNSGDYVTALEILRAHGITNGILAGMAAHLGQPIQRATLSEPFLKAWEPTKKFREQDFVQRKMAEAAAVGYPRVLWMVESHDTTRTIEQFRQSVVPPIGVMDVQLPETNVIAFIQWFNIYADQLHSVALNWSYVNNFDTRNQAEAYELLNALFQLVKARKPDIFVWLTVQPAVDNSDVRWLQTMRFEYDGLLMLRNLSEFKSKYEGIRKRLLPYVREETQW